MAIQTNNGNLHVCLERKKKSFAKKCYARTCNGKIAVNHRRITCSPCECLHGNKKDDMHPLRTDKPATKNLVNPTLKLLRNLKIRIS